MAGAARVSGVSGVISAAILLALGKIDWLVISRRISRVQRSAG